MTTSQVPVVQMVSETNKKMVETQEAAPPVKRREPSRDKAEPTAGTTDRTGASSARTAPGPRTRNGLSTTGQGETIILAKAQEPAASEPAKEAAGGKAEAKPKPMTEDETNELKACEKVIEQGLRSFTEVGRALATINGKKLYRMTHESFEAYCEEVWKMERTHAYRLIRAAGVVDDIERQAKTSSENQKDEVWPIGHTLALTSESVVRPLAKLKTPEKRYEAFQKALELASDKPLTAAIVQKAVGRRPKAAKKPAEVAAPAQAEAKPAVNPAPAAQESEDGVIDVKSAMGFLKKIKHLIEEEYQDDSNMEEALLLVDQLRSNLVEEFDYDPHQDGEAVDTDPGCVEGDDGDGEEFEA
ncbi:MAG: hypothetical protein HZA88_04910 [Verrucomicrobia bacterium]|nr:hypothetical protein [Verrucomicrobiota bacterium]